MKYPIPAGTNSPKSQFCLYEINGHHTGYVVCIKGKIRIATPLFASTEHEALKRFWRFIGAM